MEDKILQRCEVPQEDTWRLEDLYATKEEWSHALEQAKAYAEKLSAFAGTLNTAENLLAYFQLSDEITLQLESLINYAFRKSDEDTRESAGQEMSAQTMSVYVAIQTADSFSTPELMKLTDEQLESFYKQTPALAVYRRKMEDIRRQKAHILSDAEERILALAGEVTSAPENAYGMFNNADMTFPDAIDKDGKPHPLTQGTYIPYMQTTDRALRESAFHTLYAEYGKMKNTAASLLSGQIKSLEFNAKARRYENTLAAALDATNVPVSVYHNLIDAVHRNMDAMHRYVALRKELLGVDELHMYDLYAPITKATERRYSFEEAKQLVLDALAVLGEDYVAILKEGFENRWIDVYENAGKCTGAYSAGTHKHPYVLLNFHHDLESVFTLAHEMGHALHSYLSNKNQPVCDSDYVIFVAEVASTCNEALLMNHLLKITTDKAERANLINYFLEQFRGTLYRQTMFAEFELKANELSANGAGITAESLSNIYYDLNKLYFGDAITVDKDIAIEWARIPHFYYNYYVYQYATGYSAAIALSDRILTGGEAAVADYKNFLKGGCSKDPISLLKGAGVDMSTAAPIEAAIAQFNTLITEMEELARA